MQRFYLMLTANAGFSFTALCGVALALLMTGCEGDDDHNANVTPPPSDETVQQAYDNESTTVFTGRIIGALGTPLAGVRVVWVPDQYVDRGTTYNTDTSVGIEPDTTGADGFFAVVVRWDRDFGYGAIYGFLRLTRRGYPSIDTNPIGPITAAALSVGELYTGWLP